MKGYFLIQERMIKMKKTNKIIALVLAVITLLSVVCVVPVTASAKVTNVVSSSAKVET